MYILSIMGNVRDDVCAQMCTNVHNDLDVFGNEVTRPYTSSAHQFSQRIKTETFLDACFVNIRKHFRSTVSECGDLDWTILVLANRMQRYHMHPSDLDDLVAVVLDKFTLGVFQLHSGIVAVVIMIEKAGK